jgi:tetratricopeptide (TPR) repeat protein
MSFVSLLKLPFEEVKERYTRHLLLQEVGLLTELSLRALELDFLHRKEKAFALYEEVFEYEADMKNVTVIIPITQVYSLLIGLEDRYINGVVAHRLSKTFSHHSYVWRDVAWTILKNKPVEALTGQELYYMADMKSFQRIKYYELAIAKGYTKASLELARFYHSIGNREHAIKHYEEAVTQHCPCAMYELALMWRKCPDHRSRYIELLKESASLGHRGALVCVKALPLTLLTDCVPL